MSFPEIDAKIRAIISNTVGNCGGIAEAEYVDAAATSIETVCATYAGVLIDALAAASRKETT